MLLSFVRNENIVMFVDIIVDFYLGKLFNFGSILYRFKVKGL